MKPFQIEGNRVIVTKSTKFTKDVIKLLDSLNKQGHCTKHEYNEYLFKEIKKYRDYILREIEK